jgi:glycosyltransferase involved in cell wall biosynthesis
VLTAKVVIDARMLRTTTGRYIDRLLEHLQETESKHDYVVCLDDAGYRSWFPRRENFEKVLAPYPAYSMSEQVDFLALLYRLKADLVHFTMPQQPFGYFGKSVTTIHDLTLIRYSNSLSGSAKYRVKMHMFGLLLKLIARRSSALLANSCYTRDDFAAYVGLNPSRIDVTYLAADPLSAKDEAVDSLAGKNFVLYVGNAYPYKNLELLVAAHRVLVENGQDIHLVIAGKIDQYHQVVRDGLSDAQRRWVTFTGYVSDGQLHWLYQNARAYVFPSKSEGFGLPGVEAMLHGLPVLSSRSSALPEIFGEAALYFDALSRDDLVDCIVRVCTDEALRQRLVEAGLARSGSFSWRKMALDTERVYSRCLG